MNKKGISQKVLLGMIMGIIGLAVIGGVYFMLVDNLTDSSALNACRESIKLSEITTKEILSHEVGRFPLACVTQEVKIPNTNDYRLFEKSKDGAMENLAMLLVDTHYAFYEGLADKNVFGQLSKVTNKEKCFVAFNVTIDDKYSIPIGEFENYMRETDFAAVQREARDGANIECELKGGRCGKAMEVEEVVYDKWACTGSNTCLVKKDNMISYKEYIEGAELVKLFIDSATINEIRPGEDYSIVFLSPTENPSYTLSNTIYDAYSSVTGQYSSNFKSSSFIIFTKTDRVKDICISNLEE